MKSNFFSSSLANIYSKSSSKSEVLSQILYGEKFRILNKKKLVKGDIVFWKGHVGLCLNNSKFIHAYGPKKKVIIMPTKLTINLIYKTANLVVKKVSNIKNY